jgi:hypothetical protein
VGEDKERTVSFDHGALAMQQRKVHLLVVVGHGGQRWWGFWLLAAQKGTPPSTTALSAITSTPMTSRVTMTAMREGDGHYYYPTQQCGRSEESSPKVDKKTFFQLGISTISQFQQPKVIFDHQEGISDQKGRKSLPEVEKISIVS